MASRRMAWLFMGGLGQQGVTLIVTFILAAILGPRTYGVVAMAVIYIAFVQLVLDQGISTAIVQRKDLEVEHIDSAFWMNLGWAILLVGVSVAVSGWWADVNHTPQLEPIIDVLSLLIPITALTIVQQSLLQRDMEFRKLALRGNVAALSGGIAGVAAALAGAGVWALVTQQLVMAFVALCLLWAVGHWRPRLRFSRKHARELLGFSTQVFTGNLAVFISRWGDALLIGLFFGPLAVGLYRLADRLVEMLLTFGTRPLQIFSLAHLSRATSADELRTGVRTCVRLSTFATVPMMLGLAACASYITHLLGPKWEPATDAIRLLAVVGIGKAAIVFTAALLFAVGEPRLRAIAEWSFAIVSAATFAVTALFLRGTSSTDQVFGMATSRLVLFVVLFVPVNLVLVKLTTNIRMRELLKPTRIPLAAGCAGVAAVALAEHLGLLNHDHRLIGLTLALLLVAASSCAVLVLFDREVRGLLKRIARRGKRSPIPTAESAEA